MFYTANGWTKERMINHIKANFKGKAFETRPNNRFGELGSEEMCVYKTKDGKKCGIGLFFDEDTHETRHLDGTIRSLLFKWPDLEKQMPLSSVQGLTEEVVSAIKYTTTLGQFCTRVEIPTLHALDKKYDIDLVDEAIKDVKKNFRDLGYYVSGDREDYRIYFNWSEKGL